MNILFFGSSSYCLPILKTLYKSYQLVGIVTKPGSLTSNFAAKNNIPCFTPSTKKDLLAHENKLKELKPDIAIVSDFGLIIPKEIFQIPKYKTLNIHFSALPKYRGASPVQYTILNGEKSAWISVIIMDEHMDTGDIIWQDELKLIGNETSQDLYNKLFKIIAGNLPDIINQYINGKLKPVKQDNLKATYTKMLTREDGFLPFNLLSIAIQGKHPKIAQLITWKISKYLPSKFCILYFAFCLKQAMLAFTPWPGLWTLIKINDTQKRLKLLKVHIEENKLVIDSVQLEGKKLVSWKQFRQGYPDLFN